MHDDNWGDMCPTKDASGWSRQDSMIWCGGWDADCLWYTYDPSTKKYTLCTHPVSEEEAVRKAKKCYWMDEPPVYDENALNELKENGIEIDIVATHTCPSFAQPLHKKGLENWMKYDPMLENDLNYERLVMDNVYNKLIEDGHPLQKWIYGHFHYHNSEFIGDVNFVMLDMSRNGKMDVLQIHSKTEENK
jgi:hypothetical protein